MTENKENSFENADEQSSQLNDPSVSYVEGQAETSLQKSMRLENVGKYWDMLSDKKKMLVIEIIKTFAEDDVAAAIPPDHWEKIRNDRKDYLEGKGKTYTREEARKIVLQKNK